VMRLAQRVVYDTWIMIALVGLGWVAIWHLLLTSRVMTFWKTQVDTYGQSNLAQKAQLFNLHCDIGVSTCAEKLGICLRSSPRSINTDQQQTVVSRTLFPDLRTSEE
jgi:hypothetical protein